MRIGLLGGTFNPPHSGHLHLSHMAYRELQLDCIWWLVTPQNPLKCRTHTPSMATRMQAARKITANTPYIVVSDLEQALGTEKTFDFLEKLAPAFGLNKFVWIGGEDLMHHFHCWYHWQKIAARLRLAFAPRHLPPGVSGRSVFTLRYGSRQVHRPSQLLSAPLPAWTILKGPVLPLSSTNLRQKGKFADTPEYPLE